MGVSSTVQILSAIVFCTLIAASAAKSETQRRVLKINHKEAPYHVTIWFRHNYICSGTLIAINYILTTAHCVEKIQPQHYSEMTVKTGSIYLNKGGEHHSIQLIAIHPNFTYSPNGFHSNDIALIKLTDIVHITKKQRAILLSCDKPSNGTQAVVTGWLRNSNSVVLRKATTTIISNEVCQRIVNNPVEPNQFCTFEISKPNVCVSNRGSPLVQNNTLVGVLSRVDHCGIGFPDVYVSVAPYEAFILHTMFQNN